MIPEHPFIRQVSVLSSITPEYLSIKSVSSVYSSSSGIGEITMGKVFTVSPHSWQMELSRKLGHSANIFFAKAAAGILQSSRVLVANNDNRVLSQIPDNISARKRYSKAVILVFVTKLSINSKNLEFFHDEWFFSCR